MKKRAAKTFIPAIILCFGMMISLCNVLTVKAEGESGTTINNSPAVTSEDNFTIDAQGIITEYKGNDVTVIIPQKIKGTDVKGISGAFMDNVTLETVIVPSTITILGDSTFKGCTAFKAMDMYLVESPIDSGTPINEWEKAKYIFNPVEAKGYPLVEKDGEVEIKKPCVIIPKSLASMGNEVFKDANGIPGFYVMTGNAILSSTEDQRCLLSADKKNIVRFEPGQNCDGQFVIPDGVESIGSYAFEQATINGGIQFPASLKVISDYGFYNYGMVDNNLLFPEDSQLETIGSYAFSHNPKMQIKFPKSLKTIGTYCFTDNDNVAVDISETQIEKIPEYAFYQCRALHQITMPATLKEIEAYAFSDCNNLDTVNFNGDTLEKLGTGAFKDSPTLHTITIPDGVTNIEDDTFSGCTNLAVIELPDSVTTIGENAFKDCRTIEKLVIPPNVSHIANSSFEGANTEKIDTSKNEYSQKYIKGALPKAGEEFTVGNLKYKMIVSHAENGTVAVSGIVNKKTKKVTVKDTVLYNGYTFKVVEVGKNAFKKCTKLTSVTLGKNITKINANAFNGDKKLKTIIIKSSNLKNVGKNALRGIKRNAVIKVPKKKIKKYKRYFKKKTGFKNTMKIKKS